MSFKKLRNLLAILTSAILLTSCATILHEKKYAINIQSNEAKAKVKVYDSIYNLPVYTMVKRSDSDLILTLMTETKNIEFSAKPKLTNTFKFANLLGLSAAPICYLIDLSNNNRYHYGKSILLNTKDTTVVVTHRTKELKKPSFAERHQKKKGEVDLHLSMPFVNWFRNTPIGGNATRSWGFMGFSVGLDWYHSKKQFLNLSASVVTDLASPIPLPIDYFDGEPERNYSSYLSLSNNHKIKRFSLGYGLSYSKKEWVPGSGQYDTNTGVSQKYNALGLVVPAYIQLGKSFNIGVIYRPTLYRFTATDQYQYEHLISLDFAWKIKL